MIVPPGILLNLAFATTIGSAENWFILTPDSPFKYLSVYMMILHNVQAWVLWVSDMGAHTYSFPCSMLTWHTMYPTRGWCCPVRVAGAA